MLKFNKKYILLNLLFLGSLSFSQAPEGFKLEKVTFTGQGCDDKTDELYLFSNKPVGPVDGFYILFKKFEAQAGTYKNGDVIHPSENKSNCNITAKFTADEPFQLSFNPANILLHYNTSDTANGKILTTYSFPFEGNEKYKISLDKNKKGAQRIEQNLSNIKSKCHKSVLFSISTKLFVNDIDSTEERSHVGIRNFWISSDIEEELNPTACI